MAFGQQAGPPATSRQIKELLDLLRDAGHSDFRDARGPMGLTQRQAGGRFTRDEADALMTQLRDAADADAAEEGGAGFDAQTPGSAPAPRRTKAELALAQVPDGLLAAELQRRGWIVVEPE